MSPRTSVCPLVASCTIPTGVGSGASASRRLQQEQAGRRGPHLFTMGISGEIRASRLQLEPDVPDRPDSYRLGVTMELVMDSIKIQVLLSARPEHTGFPCSEDDTAFLQHVGSWRTGRESLAVGMLASFGSLLHHGGPPVPAHIVAPTMDKRGHLICHL